MQGAQLGRSEARKQNDEQCHASAKDDRRHKSHKFGRDAGLKLAYLVGGADKDVVDR